MWGDQLRLGLYRLKRRRAARARYRIIHDGSGRAWPLYHVRSKGGQVLGVPVVFFHGFGTDGSSWLSFFPELSENREIVAVDLPGFGGHDPHESDLYTPSWYAGVCVSLLRELAVRWGQPPILIGTSLGAMIAGLVACEIPDLCRAVVLIDPAGIRPVQQTRFWEDYRQGRNILLPRDETEWDTMMHTLYHQPRPLAGFLRRTALLEINAKRDMLARIFDRLFSEGDDPLGERLQELRSPVTVLWGDHDQVTDISALARFQEALPSSKRIVVENCGHCPASEAPWKTREAFLDVLARYG